MSLAFALGRLVMRVRPAPLAVLLKRALLLRREVVATPDGRFWVDPASDAGQRVYRTGRYEAATVEILGRVLHAGDTYVDVGANEGYFCVSAARLVGPAGRVVAVEPQARLAEVLRRNFELNNSRVELVAAAISDQPGIATLHLTPDVNNSATGLATHTSYRLATQSVPMLTLSQLLQQLNVTALFVLKIDIESWEHEAILGSPEIFRSGLVRVLLLELHPSFLRQRGLDPDAVPNFLRSCGYEHLAGSDGFAWVRSGTAV
ncbi:MAG: FkbM family methyltransferase [Opitutae bacterium]|nr:FkbM family methyltransferase [Opitutae bacterium]